MAGEAARFRLVLGLELKLANAGERLRRGLLGGGNTVGVRGSGKLPTTLHKGHDGQLPRGMLVVPSDYSGFRSMSLKMLIMLPEEQCCQA